MEKAIGVIVGLMGFELVGRTAFHLSLVAALFGRVLH